MAQVEYNYITGHLNQVFDSLSRSISAYKGYYWKLKVGITGRDPQARFDEHLVNDPAWERMVVIYETSSIRYANTIEEWLVEDHYDNLVNTRPGGGSQLSPEGKNYVYVLLAERK